MPCLYISPERESSSKGPKRVLGFRAGASMARFRSCGSVSPIFCPKEYVPKQCGSYLFARQSGAKVRPTLLLQLPPVLAPSDSVATVRRPVVVGRAAARTGTLSEGQR